MTHSVFMPWGEYLGAALVGASALLLPVLAWRFLGASALKRAMASGVATHLILFIALLATSWLLWGAGNTDYFMLGAPMMLVNIAAGAYYVIVIGVVVVRTMVRRSAG